HGQAVGMMLPSVLRFNAADSAARHGYAELGAAAQISANGHAPEVTAEALATRLEVLLGLSGMPDSLAEIGVEPAKIPVLAEEAARQWTAAFNPRPVSKDDFVKLYEMAFEPRR